MKKSGQWKSTDEGDDDQYLTVQPNIFVTNIKSNK